MKPILAAVIALLLAAPAAPPKSQTPPAQAQPGKPTPLHKFLRFGWPKVSRGTTYLTEPLTADGLVNYSAALNQRNSAGVTNDNNAAVLFLQATGPRENDKGEFSAACNQLGIEAPRSADCLQPFSRFYTQLNKDCARDPQAAARSVGIKPSELAELFNDPNSERDIAYRCQRGPWRLSNEPIAAAWLAKNNRPMDRLIVAAYRPKFYLPYPVDAGAQGLTRSWWMTGILLQIHALRMRAMSQVAEDEFEKAWQDAITAYRLGVHFSSRGLLIDRAIGLATVREALQIMATVVNHPSWTAEQLNRLNTDFANLPAFPNLATTYSQGERYFTLEVLNGFVRKGIAVAWQQRYFAANGFGFEEGESLPSAQRVVTATILNWDEVFRSCNRRFDRIEQVLLLQGSRRRAAADQFDARQSAIARRHSDPYYWLTIATLDFASLRKILAIEFLETTYSAESAVSVRRLADLDDQTNAELSLTQLSLALARFRADHRAYPAKLDELSPRYLQKVPLDPYDDKPIRYRREKVGFALYSVGPNAKDEEGRNDFPNAVSLLTPENDNADDIVYRIPWQPPK